MTDQEAGDDLYGDLMRAADSDLRRGAAEVDRTSKDEQDIRRRKQWDDYSLGKHVHRIKVAVLWTGAGVFAVLAVLLAVAFVGLAGHHVLTTIRPDPNATAGLLVDLIQSVLLVLATLFVPSLWKRVG